MEPYLIGADPMKIEDLWTVLFRGGFYRGGGILMSAISGIDQALWDIKGKYFNVPVWQLMGGSCRDKMRGYRWGGGDRRCGPRCTGKEKARLHRHQNERHRRAAVSGQLRQDRCPAGARSQRA